MISKPTRKRDKKLLKEVREKKCVVDFLCYGPVDPAHVITRAAGGPDEDWNLIPLCRKHHSQQHNDGWPLFYARYGNVWFYLLNLGWDLRKVKPEHPKWDRKIHLVGGENG